MACLIMKKVKTFINGNVFAQRYFRFQELVHTFGIVIPHTTLAPGEVPSVMPV